MSASSPARWYEAHPERCLWASNWPHPGRKPVPDDADMLALLSHWAPDSAVRRKILVDNPEKLYGFELCVTRLADRSRQATVRRIFE